MRRRKVLASLGGVSAAAALLVACGDDDDSSSSSSSGTGSSSSSSGSSGASGATGAASSGGGGSGNAVKDRLVMAFPYTEDEFNDVRWNQAGSAWQVRPNYETLLTLDRKTGQLVANIATDWEVRDDTTLWFKLRDDVKFQKDFGPMTADDVAYSFDYADSLKDHPISESGVVHELVKSVEIVNPNEVIVHLDHPDAQALTFLAGDLYTYTQVLSKADWEKRGSPVDLVPLDQPPIAGTGPWEYVSRKPAENIVFKRVEDHWRKTPDFKELEVRIINEASTLLSALLAGEVDVAALPTDLQETAIDRGMKRLSGNVPGSRVFIDFLGCGIEPDTKKYANPDSPLLDVRVRKALNKAIDREALNKAFMGDRAEVMILNHFHPTREGWDPSWADRWDDEYGFDSDAAKKLLQEAGFSDSSPLKITLYNTKIPALPQAGDVMETIVGYWNAIGVDVNFETIDAATLSDNLTNHQVKDALRMVNTQSTVSVGFDVYNANRRSWIRDEGAGTSGFTTLDTTNMLIDALTVMDPDKFAGEMKEIGEISFTQHFTVPLFWIPSEVIVNPKVVASWEWHGSLSGIYSNMEYIEAVKA
jgi:ABC-type transport system substrate-binding protein